VYTFKEGINVTSGNNHVSEDAIIKNDVQVGYEITGGKNLTFAKNIEGIASAKDTITIEGNIIGKRKG
jgi:hypothetical protein